MSEPSYAKRWEIVRELGDGGQGKVSLVRDTEKVLGLNSLVNGASASLLELTHASIAQQRLEAFEQFRNVVLGIVQGQDDENLAALKQLHDAKDARDPAKADERLRLEIKGMRQVTHSNLLHVLDADPDQLWFVSEYHPGGTLANASKAFQGDALAALRAFRPLVEGVAVLHAKKLVHRDVKPANIFIASDRRLVLGDFGLVFFQDEAHTRISETIGNVGSRDWMPGWAFGQRVEELRATFDVFGLGKLLWCMLTGRPLLNLWYFREGDNDAEKMFPDVPAMRFANELLAKCVVEREHQCLPSAQELLEEVDETIALIEGGAQAIGDSVDRKCRVCVAGTYGLIVDRQQSGMRNFGLSPTGVKSFKAFACDNCGHVDMFYFENREGPPAWGKKE